MDTINCTHNDSIRVGEGRSCQLRVLSASTAEAAQTIIQQYKLTGTTCTNVPTTLCHRSSRARMLLSACGVGTAVWYLYAHALVYTCGFGTQQYGICTRSCCVDLQAYSCEQYNGIYTRSVLVWVSPSGGVGTVWVWYGTWYGTVWHGM